MDKSWYKTTAESRITNSIILFKCTLRCSDRLSLQNLMYTYKYTFATDSFVNPNIGLMEWGVLSSQLLSCAGALKSQLPCQDTIERSWERMHIESSVLTSTEVNLLAELSEYIMKKFVTMPLQHTNTTFKELGNGEKVIKTYVSSSKLDLHKISQRPDIIPDVSKILKNNGVEKEDTNQVKRLIKLVSNVYSEVSSIGTYMSKNMQADVENMLAEVEKMLATYVTRWNSKGYPVKLKSVKCRYAQGRLHFGYELAPKVLIIHSDRNFDHFLMDGKSIYPYKLFESQMRVDTWKIALEKPSYFITPGNCHHFNGEGITVRDVTDILLSDSTDIVALQLDMGHEYLHLSKVIFYRKSKDGYVVLTAHEPEVKKAKDRLELAKTLTEH